jgi:hypothetical protein
MKTHEVLNQPPPRAGLDELSLNNPLVEWERHQAGSATDLLSLAPAVWSAPRISNAGQMRPTPIRRVWLPTTVTGTGSTRSSTTPRITR